MTSNNQLQTSNSDMRFGIFHLVWLDAAMGSRDIQAAEQNLRSIINHLKKFQDVEQCQNYIERCSSIDRIVMIVSSELGQQIISSIYKLRQVISIYVYSMDQKYNAQWSDKYVKVKAVVFELDKLVSRIKTDFKIQKKMEEPLSISFFNTSSHPEKSIAEMNDQFIFSQLLIDYLPRIKPSEVNSKELISHCEQQYADNSFELSNLREFQQNYASDQALSWYTRKLFLYDTVNAVLCKQDIYSIFLFRTFLADIRNALQNHQTQSFLRVYRSLIMTSHELEIWKLFCGQFVSMNSFFSASTDYHRVVSLINIPNAADNIEAVLFEIDANPTMVTTKSFADITSFSESKDTSEILFMAGSIFRLTSINRSSNGLLWVIRMTLSSDNEYPIKEVLTPMKQQIESGEIGLQSLGKTLYKMEKFNLAERYYLHLIQRLPSNHCSLHDLYEGLSEVAAQTGDSEKSAQWHQKALQLKPGSTNVVSGAKKRILKEIEQLKNIIETDDGGSKIFLLDKTSDDDSSLIKTERSFVIIGRVFPNRGVFKQASFQIKITLAPEYPFKPPVVCFITPIYHPNISAEGGVFLSCIGDNWSPSRKIADVVKALLDVIDYPNAEYPINSEAAKQFASQKGKFNRTALEMIHKHGLPRD